MERKNNAGKICKSGEEDIVFKQIYNYHHRAIVIDRQFYSNLSIERGREGMGMVGGLADKHDIVKGLWTLSFLPSRLDYWENCPLNKLFDFVKDIGNCYIFDWE